MSLSDAERARRYRLRRRAGSEQAELAELVAESVRGVIRDELEALGSRLVSAAGPIEPRELVELLRHVAPAVDKSRPTVDRPVDKSSRRVTKRHGRRDVTASVGVTVRDGLRGGRGGEHLESRPFSSPDSENGRVAPENAPRDVTPRARHDVDARLPNARGNGAWRVVQSVPAGAIEVRP